MQPERKEKRHHGPVTLDELLTTVNGSPGNADRASSDAYLDEPITIDEVLRALNKVPRGWGR